MKKLTIGLTHGELQLHPIRMQLAHLGYRAKAASDYRRWTDDANAVTRLFLRRYITGDQAVKLHGKIVAEIGRNVVER